MARKITRRRTQVLFATAVAVALGTAACGGGDSSSTGGGGGAAKPDASSKGPITFVTGKDNSNVWAPTIAKWNAAHPSEKVTLKEQSDNADQQHDDIVQHMQAKDASYDIVTTDVVWTAEFAAKGWLTPLEGAFAIDAS
jgi:multiple sugar transport system substrate-binding protein